VLSGFKQGGFLSFTGTPSQRASIAVVVSGPPPSQTSDAIDAANTGLLAIANELDRQGRGAVVAGPEGSALPGGLVGALRNSAVKNAVSSDDIADTASGMASVVVALHQQVGQQTGQYGTGPGADSFAPVLTSPAP
jgi:hypothetical protein